MHQFPCSEKSIVLHCECARLIRILNKLYIILCDKVENVIKPLITYFCIPQSFDFLPYPVFQVLKVDICLMIYLLLSHTLLFSLYL